IKKIILALVCSVGLFAANSSTSVAYIPAGCAGLTIYTSCGAIKHTMVCDADRQTILNLGWFWNEVLCHYE
ncbi:MAG: hypothetical protein LBP63_05475, partial [Prevotellaceae bacterium]|nr:hypothetical protein [Prevotellaceae bacterium]